MQNQMHGYQPALNYARLMQGQINARIPTDSQLGQTDAGSDECTDPTVSRLDQIETGSDEHTDPNWFSIRPD